MYNRTFKEQSAIDRAGDEFISIPPNDPRWVNKTYRVVLTWDGAIWHAAIHQALQARTISACSLHDFNLLQKLVATRVAEMGGGWIDWVLLPLNLITKVAPSNPIQ